MQPEKHPRATADLAERRQAKALESRLRTVLERTTAAALAASNAAPGRVLDDLAVAITEILGVACAVVGEFVDDSKTTMRTRAVRFDGRVLANFEYDVMSTACRHIVGRASRFLASGVRSEFAPDSIFYAEGIDSYAGYALSANDGRQVGVIVALDRKPIADQALTETILKILAARASAEIERERAEANYRAVFESAEDAILVLDWTSARILDANPKACATRGYTRDEILRLGIAELSANVPPYTMEQARKYFEAAKRSPHAVRFEWLRKNKDGTLHVDEVDLKAGQLGGHKCMFAFVREITERKRTEKALRDSEEMYREIFNASADAMVLRDADFRVVDVNPAYSSMSGYTRAETLGAHRVLTVTPEENLRWRSEHERMLKGEHLRFEFRARRKDGTPYEAELHGMPVTYDGRPHVLYVSRDITERKHAELALRVSEEQYRTIFNVSDDVMVVRDEAMLVVDANPAFFELQSATREEVIGVRYPLFVGEPNRAAAEALIRDALAGRPGKLEIQIRRKDGEVREFDVRAMPMVYRGRPHVLAIGRDLTVERGAERERRRLEVQLRQAQKMEAIGQLTGGIAHDFNNILGSIMGYNVLALERALDACDAKTAMYLEEALGSCRRARDLIQQMLTFSRGERGEPRRLSLRRLVEDTTPLLRSSLPPTIVFELDCEPTSPMVLVDEIQAGQVLLNLCINARDAMQGVGRLKLDVRELHTQGLVCASCHSPVLGRCVALSVADTGSGIEPAVQERMFEPFFSTKDKGKGSGMGLSMVHGIVHEHGGHVVVQSTPGRGSTFTVLWPAAEGAVDPLQGPAQVGALRARSRLSGRVLLVDDERAIRGFMQEMLGEWGLTVTAAADGGEALRAFDAAPLGFDLVISDQAMPTMTGLALTAQLRARQPELPIILCAGYTDEGIVAEAQRCGVQGLLHKPLEAAQLRAAVEAALSRQFEDVGHS